MGSDPTVKPLRSPLLARDEHQEETLRGCLVGRATRNGGHCEQVEHLDCLSSRQWIAHLEVAWLRGKHEQRHPFDSIIESAKSASLGDTNMEACSY